MSDHFVQVTEFKSHTFSWVGLQPHNLPFPITWHQHVKQPKHLHGLQSMFIDSYIFIVWTSCPQFSQCTGHIWPTWPTNSSFVRSFLLVVLCPRGGLFVCPHSTGGPGLVAPPPRASWLLQVTRVKGAEWLAGWLAGRVGSGRWYGGRGNDLETKREFSAACDTPGSQPPCEVLCDKAWSTPWHERGTAYKDTVTTSNERIKHLRWQQFLNIRQACEK